MSYVEIYKLQNDGNQKIVATCRLVSNQVVIEGDDNLVEDLKVNGIYDYSNPTNHTKLFPGDGLKFLEQLKFNFKSGYLNASEVKKT